MPSLIDLRRRIRSVKNTQQITKAMKMMSAARLRRAQERVIASRPYAAALRQMLSRVVASLPDDALNSADGPLHPLLARREEKRVLLIVLGGDKGLAGAFNSNIHKSVLGYLAEHGAKSIDIVAVGRKPREFFKRRGPLTAEFADIFAKVQLSNAKEIAKIAIDRYTAGEADAVYIVYNEFKSVLVQRLQFERLLPLDPPAPPAADAAAQSGKSAADQPPPTSDYIFEQPPVELLASMLPRYVEVQLFRSLLESAAAEHAARMTAMDSASKNASEMITRLTLNMNRIRQASITREIIEIVSGAAALG